MRHFLYSTSESIDECFWRLRFNNGTLENTWYHYHHFFPNHHFRYPGTPPGGVITPVRFLYSVGATIRWTLPFPPPHYYYFCGATMLILELLWYYNAGTGIIVVLQCGDKKWSSPIQGGVSPWVPSDRQRHGGLSSWGENWLSFWSQRLAPIYRLSWLWFSLKTFELESGLWRWFDQLL